MKSNGSLILVLFVVASSSAFTAPRLAQQTPSARCFPIASTSQPPKEQQQQPRDVDLISQNRESLRQAEEEHFQRYTAPVRQRFAPDQALFQGLMPSFKNVERLTEYLLNNQPLVATAVFLLAGLVTAYALGLVFLDGYISSLNPADNGGVPYFSPDNDVPTNEDQLTLHHALQDAKVKMPSLWFWD